MLNFLTHHTMPSQSSKLLLILQSPGEVSPLLEHLPPTQSALIMAFAGFYGTPLRLPTKPGAPKGRRLCPPLAAALSKSLAPALAPCIGIV